MTTFNIKETDQYSINMDVRESDKYTEAVYVKLTRSYDPADRTGCSEMCITVDELYSLGKFITRQADEIYAQQAERRVQE